MDLGFCVFVTISELHPANNFTINSPYSSVRLCFSSAIKLSPVSFACNLENSSLLKGKGSHLKTVFFR